MTKKNREEALVKLAGKVKNLCNVLNLPNLNARTLQSKLFDVETFLPLLKYLHTKYVKRGGPGYQMNS